MQRQLLHIGIILLKILSVLGQIGFLDILVEFGEHFPDDRLCGRSPRNISFLVLVGVIHKVGVGVQIALQPINRTLIQCHAL